MEGIELEMCEMDTRLWIRAAPPLVREWLNSSIVVRNFLRERHRESFQMLGRYDGAMSEQCKNEFRKEYRILTAIIEETEGQ